MSPPDQAARDQALRLDRHIVAIAPAGSGKTGLLVQRFLAALATCERPEQVVAITFTTKAAAEIRDRVLAALTNQVDPPADDTHAAQQHALAQAVRERDAALGWALATTPSRLRAQTIDGLNTAIAAELPLFSRLGGRLQISDDAPGLIEAAIDSLFASALGADADPALASAASDLLASVNNRLDTLTRALVALMERRDQWTQDLISAEAVDDDAPLGWLVELQIAAQQRLRDVLGTDTARLLDALRAVAHDNEAFAWAAELTAWPSIDPALEAEHRRLATVLLTKTHTLRKPGGIKADMGFKAKTPAHTLLKALITDRDGDTELEAAAVDLVTLPPPRLDPALAQFRRQLRRVLHHLLAHHRLVMSGHGETDFVEMALAAREALRPEGGYGDALLKRDAQIRHLLVDEMQDTSAAQVALLEQLTEGWQSGDGRSLFMVGDPQQSIYAFRKADVRVFTQLIEQRQLGGLTLDVLALHANFRSDPAVVEWVNQALAPCFPAKPDLDRGEVPFTHGHAQKPPAGGSVTVHGFAHAHAEARAAADLIEASLARGPDHTVAVLARARKHLVPLIDELRHRQLPFSGVEIDPLASRPAVRDLLACLRARWHAADHLSWLIWLRAPWVGLSWADLLRLSRGRRDWVWRSRLDEADLITLSAEGGRRVSRLVRALQAIDNDARLRTDLPAAVRSLWQQLGGDASLSAQDHVDVARCLDLIDQHAGGGGLNLPALQRAVAKLYAEPGAHRLQLMTLHKAKGLEFDTVLLLGCGNATRGDSKPLLSRLELPQQTPILVPKPPAAMAADGDWPRLFTYSVARERAISTAEGLRLLYVATTRAKQHLHLLATGSVKDGEAQLRFGANTFAARLGIVFPLDDAAVVPDEVAFDRQRAPLAPRLPLTADALLQADAAAPAGLPIPVERRSVRPSERVLAPDEDALAADGERLAQWRGRLFHQAMEAISLEGMAAWNDDPARRRASMHAALHRAGLPPDAVTGIADEVMTAVQQTLASATGQTVLGPWPWAASEYPLAGFVDGEWTSAVIDRCFETADGTVWIIDYKLARAGDDAGDPATMMQAAADHYRPQIDRYARLMTALRPGRPVQTALYLVALDALVDRDGQPLAPPQN